MNLQRWMPHVPRLLWLLTAVLLVLAGWNAWRLAALLRGTRAAAAQARAQLADAPTPLSAAQAWQRLLAADLFGVPARGDAPATTLPLKLEGVWADADGRGYAMIAADNTPARVYATGATLPYGATLRSVLADRVLLDTAAGVQSLALPKPDAGAAQQAPAGELALDQTLPPQLAGPPPPGQAPLSNALAPSPKPMVWPSGQGPLQVGDAVVGTPVLRDGRIAGYMLRPGRDAAAFVRLGLHPGDILVGIDGQPVGNPAQGGQALRQALQGGPVRIQVERDGHTVSLEAHAPGS